MMNGYRSNLIKMSEYIEDNILNPNEYDQVFFDDGKIYIYNSDDEYETSEHISAETWIEKHNDVLLLLFSGLKDFQLCTHASFSDFCEYMYYVSDYTTNDLYIWESEAPNYAYRFFNHKRPTLREFTAHYIFTIIDMYRFMINNSNFALGPVHIFAEYVYIYSDHKILN